MSAELLLPDLGTDPHELHPAAVGAPVPGGDARGPWDSVLGDLERGVDEAEALVAPGFLLDPPPSLDRTAWVPPTDIGPLTTEHAARVASVLERIERLVPRVESAAQASRKHLQAVGSLRTNDSSTAVYVDTVG